MLPSSQLKNHVSLTSGESINAICKDFFKRTGIIGMGLSCTFPNGSRSLLWNNSEWLADTLSQNIFMNYFPFQEIKDKYVLHSQLARTAHWSKSYRNYVGRLISFFRDRFQCDNRLSVYMYAKDHIKMYTFAGHVSNPNMVNYYINHKDEIEQFIDYFQEQAADIITQANKNPIIKPWRTPTKKDLELFSVYKKDDIHNLNKADKAICTKLSNGLTAKQIAEELHRSPRTIESRLDDLRSRLGCQTRSQLAAKFATAFPYLINKG